MTLTDGLVEMRLARAPDAQFIAELSRDRIEHGLGWSWQVPRVLRSIREPEINVVVAERGGNPVGFGIMNYRDEDAHLSLLAVAASASRIGIGSALVGWLERSARIAGIASLTLEARVRNEAARAFYGRLGYRETETLPGYYQGREACVRLVKQLRETPVAP